MVVIKWTEETNKVVYKSERRDIAVIEFKHLGIGGIYKFYCGFKADYYKDNKLPLSKSDFTSNIFSGLLGYLGLFSGMASLFMVAYALVGLNVPLLLISLLSNIVPILLNKYSSMREALYKVNIPNKNGWKVVGHIEAELPTKEQEELQRYYSGKPKKRGLLSLLTEKVEVDSKNNPALSLLNKTANLLWYFLVGILVLLTIGYLVYIVVIMPNMR